MQTTSRSVGAYVASEAAYVAWGRMTAALPKAVLYLQGSHGISDSLKGDTTINRLSDEGYVSICGDLSQTASQGTFGNTTSQTRTGQLKTYVQGSTSPFQAAAGKVAILAASGGAAAGINFALANPTLVSCIYGVCPLVALQDVYENRTDAAVTQAEIRAAYGNAVPTYSTHDPSYTGRQAALSGIPIRIAYSTDDPYVPQSIVEAYRDLVNNAGGNCTLISQGAVGHSALGLDRDDLIAFYEAHA